jgi:hypothetical protein
MRKSYQKVNKTPINKPLWQTAEDIYLIEHAHLSIVELQQHLRFSEEQILARKKQLGLIRRAKQLHYLNK